MHAHATVTFGNLAYGLRDEREIIDLPKGANKVRVRMRCDDFAYAFVRFPDRIQKHLLLMDGPGRLRIGYLQAVTFSKPFPKPVSTAAPCPTLHSPP